MHFNLLNTVSKHPSVIDCSPRSSRKIVDGGKPTFLAPNRPLDWLLRLHTQIEVLAHKHSRLDYRRLARLLRRDGWQVGRKLVQRIQREHGLRV